MLNGIRRLTKRVIIAIVGGLVVLVGLVLIPYPGPGWLIVFGGLAILSTEFTFASRVLEFVKGKYDAWVEWVKRQNIFMRVIILSFTGIIVLVTIWLVNGLGIINSLLNLSQEWHISPLFR